MISDRDGVGRTPILLAILVMAIVVITAIGLAIMYLPSNNPSVPDAPSGLHATIGNHLVMLTWEEPSNNGADITSYKIYRGTSSDDLQFEIWLGLVLSYNDTSVLDGETYHYAVSAVNSKGEGEISANVSVTIPTPPSAPRSLLANQESTRVTLTWSSPASDGGSPIIGYKIFRSNSSGDYGDSPFATESSFYYIDNLVGVEGHRFYIVKSYNAFGDSSASNEVDIVAETLVTPTITMMYQKTASLKYTFTVVGMTANDILWTDIAAVVSPLTGTLEIPTTAGMHVGAGDTCVFTASAADTYTITLIYTPTGGATYSLTLNAF